MVGQVGLEPTTALSTEFTVRGDTNYTVLTYIGTGGWIRTNEYRSQSPVPYRLATPVYYK